MKVKKYTRALVGGLGLTAAATPALAELELNMPVGVTSISRDVYQLHMWILWIVVAIGVLVFGAMIYSVINHRKSKNPVPAKFHHSTTVEIVWTVIPLLILVGMMIPATTVLVDMYDTDEADLTVKVTGYQWRWGYEYLEEGISFISVLESKSDRARQLDAGDDLEAIDNYLLEVDRELVLPVGKKVRFLLTSNDVIHSWWVPAFGWKKDAIPGFVNEAWTRIDEPGVYRGQCAELCGRDHAYMPVVVRAVPEEEYLAWVAEQQDAEAPAALADPLAEDIAEEEVVPTEEQVTAAETAPPSAADVAEAAADMTLEDAMERGEQIYTMNCVACHGAQGEGGVGTPIAGGPISTGDIAEHINIVLRGKGAMPPWGQLSDEDIAAVITYERNAFGNESGDIVQPADIGAAR